MSSPPLVTLRPAPHVLTLTPFYPAPDDDANGCFVAEPLPWLEKVGIRNTVMAVQPSYRGRLKIAESAPKASAISFWCLPGGLGLSTAGAFLFARIVGTVRELHKRDPIAVIHAHSALPCGHAAALLSRELKIPFVVSVHGRDAFSTVQVTGRAGEWCRSVSRMVYDEARRVICVSGVVADEVMRGAANAPATVIYNGVDPELFKPATAGAASQPVILSVGNLIASKGHDTLLRAVAEVKKGHPDILCEIIGDGPERTRLAALAAELNIAAQVRFLGRQSRHKVAEAMSRCTVFALPSRYEGLGCVYLEAMAAGKVAIACHAQGIEEIIEHEANGFLVAPDHPDELAATLTRALADDALRSYIGNRARGTILAGLTLSHQAAHLASIYRECAL